MPLPIQILRYAGPTGPRRASTGALAFLNDNGTLADETLTAAARALEQNARLAGVLIVPGADEAVVRCWRDVPAAIAALARPWPRVSAVCIRASLWEGAAGVSPDHESVWRGIVAASRTGHEFAVISAGAACETLAVDEALPVLAPRGPSLARGWLLQQLRALRPGDLVPDAASPDDAIALQAGLLQLHDALDESHALSQSIEGRGRHQSGDYWHGIMHRREPDDSNAKYWFRQLGAHPVCSELAPAADAILARCKSPEVARWRERLGTPEAWDPFAFVDLCAHCRRSGDAGLDSAARRMQLTEMLLLLIHTWRDAAGRP